MSQSKILARVASSFLPSQKMGLTYLLQSVCPKTLIEEGRQTFLCLFCLIPFPLPLHTFHFKTRRAFFFFFQLRSVPLEKQENVNYLSYLYIYMYICVYARILFFSPCLIGKTLLVHNNVCIAIGICRLFESCASGGTLIRLEQVFF